MMIDDYLSYLYESAMAVMGCRAAKAGIVSLSQKLKREQNPEKRLWLQKQIIKYRKKVAKCRARNLMI